MKNNKKGRSGLWIENPSYSAMHKWVVRNYGRAHACSNNKGHSSLSYDWANISGEYKRDIGDWKQLCRKCHLLFDMTKERMDQIRKMSAGFRKPIAQYTKDRELIKKFDYISEAGMELGVDVSAICKVLKGKRVTAGGFKYEYL